MAQDEYANVDLSNQIDNPISKDTVLAMKFGNNLFYSVKLCVDQKKFLLKKFVPEGEKGKRKGEIIVIIYSFLLYHLIKGVGPRVNKYKLCNDVRPIESVIRNLSIICKYYGEKPFQNQGYKIRKKDASYKSPAHKIANNTSNGRIKENFSIREKDLEDLTKIINQIYGK